MLNYECSGSSALNSDVIDDLKWGSVEFFKLCSDCIWLSCCMALVLFRTGDLGGKMVHPDLSQMHKGQEQQQGSLYQGKANRSSNDTKTSNEWSHMQQVLFLASVLWQNSTYIKWFKEAWKIKLFFVVTFLCRKVRCWNNALKLPTNSAITVEEVNKGGACRSYSFNCLRTKIEVHSINEGCV